MSSFTETMGFMSPQSTCAGDGVEYDAGAMGFEGEHAADSIARHDRPRQTPRAFRNILILSGC
jgi:hypothetical protein